MNDQSPFVIAISGSAGAGKTTLVNVLAERLGGAAKLFFDDFSADCKWWPLYGPEAAAGDHYQKWLREGGNPDHYVSAPQFAAALRTLRNGAAQVSVNRFVVIEEPWGRSRRETAEMIDFVAHIDLLLDVALCRRLLHDAEQGGNILKVIRQYHDLNFTYYYQHNRETPGRTADLVMDGMRTPDELAADLIDTLKSKLGLHLPEAQKKKEARSDDRASLSLD